MQIDDSMWFWVQDALKRGKGRETAEEEEVDEERGSAERGGDGQEAAEAGLSGTRVDREKGEDEGTTPARAEHVEHLSERGSTTSRGNAGQGTSETASMLPEVADTGGRLDFDEAGRERGHSG